MDRRENAVFRYKTTGKQNEGGGVRRNAMLNLLCIV